MGLFGSKEVISEHDALVFDKSKIKFDDFGNLIYGGFDSVDVDREAEAKAIMSAENIVDDKTAGQKWWIVDSAWVESWLHYVHIAPDVPRPGPCRNDRLIERDENGKWVGRPRMQMAVRSRKGDYRRVTEETWKQIVAFYPGSGPCITMIYTYDEKLQDSGAYDVSSWVIADDASLADKGKPRKLLHHVGSTFKIVGGAFKKNGSDGAAESAPSSSSAASKSTLQTAGGESGSSGIEMQGESVAGGQIRSSEPDSDDDDEEAPLGKGNKSGASPTGASTKIMMSRSYLGSKPGNDVKDPTTAYKKVDGGSDRGSTDSVDGTAAVRPVEDTRRESFFADVFFGAGSKPE